MQKRAQRDLIGGLFLKEQIWLAQAKRAIEALSRMALRLFSVPPNKRILYVFCRLICPYLQFFGDSVSHHEF